MIIIMTIYDDDFLHDVANDSCEIIAIRRMHLQVVFFLFAEDVDEVYCQGC